MDFYGEYYDNETYDDYLNESAENWTNHSDSWCEAGDSERTIRVIQTCVFCVVFIIGVCGNVLVIASFSVYGRKRLRSMTDVFLVHLATADLLLLLTLPLQATDTHLGWIFSTQLCKLTRACYAINTYSGLLLLACISVDRYMLVARARDMLRLRTHILRAGLVAAVVVWIISVILSLPEILFSGISSSNLDSEPFCGPIHANSSIKRATNTAIIAIFTLSLVVMVTCYSLIARVLLYANPKPQNSQHAKNSKNKNKKKHGQGGHKQRTLKLMLVLVAVFIVFQLPYTVVLSFKMAAGGFCGVVLEYVTCAFAYARCGLNPILYALGGGRFRGDVTKLVKKVCRGKGKCGGGGKIKTDSHVRSSSSSHSSSACSPTVTLSTGKSFSY